VPEQDDSGSSKIGLIIGIIAIMVLVTVIGVGSFCYY
jgi:hypothetical protein